MDYKKIISEKGSLWMNIGIVVLFAILVFLIFQMFKPITPKETVSQEVVFRREVFFPDDLLEDDLVVLDEETLTEKQVVTPIEKEMPQVKEAVTPASQEALGRFFVQVASFRDRKKAELIAEELQKKDHVAMVERRDLSEKGVWYRVQVGGFASKDQAQKMLEDIREEYPEAFVIQR